MNSVTTVRHGRQGCGLLAPGIRLSDKNYRDADSRGRKLGISWKCATAPSLYFDSCASNTPHLNPMRIVDQPVEDAVSQCGIAICSCQRETGSSG